MTQPDKPRCETCRYPVHGCVTHQRDGIELCDFCGQPADTDEHTPKETPDAR